MNATWLQNNVGLSVHDATVYLVLVDIGHGTIADIVKKTSLHRPTVYTAIESLQVQQLVSVQLQGKRTHYSAASPTILKRIMEHRVDDLEKVLPSLMERYDKRNLKPRVQFFQGKDAPTFVYEDMLSVLEKGDIFYRYESPEDYTKQDKFLPSEYFERVCTKREVEKYVVTNEITNEKKQSQLERAVKVVPASFDIFQYNITQIIYADRVGFIDFENECAWIVVDRRFAVFQTSLFRLLFEKL
jgi:sugar-specific transcriptional regulator TrmB